MRQTQTGLERTKQTLQKKPQASNVRHLQSDVLTTLDSGQTYVCSFE